MSEEAPRTLRITWVHAGDHKRPASIGLDETIVIKEWRTVDTIDDVREDALYYGKCAGIDLDRYTVVVEEIGNGDD